jgi:hypothetical protein
MCFFSCFFLLLLLLYAYYIIVDFFYFYTHFPFCAINFTITIFLSLLPPTSLSLFLCYNPLISFPPTLSATSHPLSHHSHLHLLFSLNLSLEHPTLVGTHHLLTNLLYQLYTTPNPCNLCHNHHTLPQNNYTQTHKGHKTQ